MKRSKIANAMDSLDETLIAEAATAKRETGPKKSIGGSIMKALNGWKKWTAVAAACLILFGGVLGVTLLIKNGNGAAGALKSRDMYAMSAVSSIEYLTQEGASGAKLANKGVLLGSQSATARPDTVKDADVEGIENCISMFDGMLSGGGFDQSVKVNGDLEYAQYAYKMTISLHDGVGAAGAYVMYFNETGTKTDVEIDDGVEEIEESTQFDGIVLYVGQTFTVSGVKEVEKEGNEVETEIEFTTRSAANPSNFVVVSQSFENDEVEYEYEFFRNGVKQTEMEIEYEQTRKGAKVEFELEDRANGTRTAYEVRKGGGDMTFVVEFIKNGKRDRITVTENANGTFTFVYSNGFSETL